MPGALWERLRAAWTHLLASAQPFLLFYSPRQPTATTHALSVLRGPCSLCYHARAGAQLCGVALKRVPGRVLKASCCTEMVDSDSSVAVLVCRGNMSKRVRIHPDTNGREVGRSYPGSSGASGSGASGSFSSSSGGKRLREEGQDSEENHVADGKRYKGKFHKEHWQGTVITDDGAKYEGQFYEDKIHGQGTYTFPSGVTSGNKYEGKWREGQYISGSANSDEQNESTTCVVCQVKEREMAFTPCYHLCVCKGCANFEKFNGKCPICRQPVTGMLRMYG